MKTLILSLVLFTSLSAISQIQSSIIHQGSIIDLFVYPGNGTLQSTLVVEKFTPDTVTFDWSITSSSSMGDRSGRRTMAAASIIDSKSGFWDPPFHGEDVIIPSSQSMLILSRKSFQELKKSGSTEFDDQLIHWKKKGEIITHEINGRKLKAIEATNDAGDTRMLILDDETFPIILKLDGNPYRVDIEITSIR